MVLVAVLVGQRPAGRLRLPDVLTYGLAVGVPMLLVLAQNDSGTAASFAPLLFAAVFVSGLRWRWIAAAAVGFGHYVIALFPSFASIGVLVIWNPLSPVPPTTTQPYSASVDAAASMPGLPLMLGTAS